MRKLPRGAAQSSSPRTDPAYAPTVEVFDNLTHDEIHTKVGLLDPVVLAGGRQAWADSGAGLADAVTQAHNEIRGAIADGWRGSAASSAAAAVRAFEQHGQALADVFAEVSRRLGRAGDAAEALRSAVTGPTDLPPNLAAALLDPNEATGNIAAQKQNEHSRQDVVRAMEDIYTGAFIVTGNEVPAFPDAPVDGAAGSTSSHAVAPIEVPDSAVTQPASFAPGAGVTSLSGGPLTAPVTEDTPATTTASATTPTTAPPTPAATGDPASAPKTAPVAGTAAASVAAAAAHATSTPHRGHTPAPTVAATESGAPSATLGPRTTSASSSDDDRKRREQPTEHGATGAAAAASTGGHADAAGAGAMGAMGGMMGGAILSGDTPRQGSSVTARAVNARPPFDEDDEDDDFEFDLDDDVPTFLEPSPEGGELVGSLDPTTPPVLGDWTELE
ncbi:PPE domain-containing protein [Nocardia callitridis]|uniref:PPE domain-containing protein n=1 Tax=Nocardia callitridis TaxID=648753 RepID=A0ABP9JTK9_9NOCA